MVYVTVCDLGSQIGKVFCIRIYKFDIQEYCIPVVPHKAVAEVSRIGNVKEIGCCESRMSEQKH